MKNLKVIIICIVVVIIASLVPIVFYIASNNSSGGEDSDYSDATELQGNDSTTSSNISADSSNENGKPHEHTVIVDPAVQATCTSPGKTEGSHCLTCGMVIKPQELVEAFGHTVVMDKEVAATCAAPGKTWGSHCSGCGEVFKPQDTIDALSHTEIVDKAIMATCSSAGKTEGSHCAVCGVVIKVQSTIMALGHTEVIDKGYSATCTKNGLSDGKHCSVCNIVIQKPVTIKATGHVVVTDKAENATCTISGKTEGAHCSVCNTIIKAQVTINATGHTVVTDNAVKATCTQSGKTEGSHCSMCNLTITPQVVINAHHNFGSDNICTSCGYEIKVTTTLTYKLNADNKSYTVTGITNSYERDIVIPDTYNGKPVTGIDSNAFAGCNNILSISIHANIAFIGKGAFSGCASLSNIYFFGTQAQWIEISTNIRIDITCGDYLVYCTDGILSKNGTVVVHVHTIVIEKAKDATCTQDGKTEGSHCSSCGVIIKPQVVISAYGHKAVVDKGYAATCVVPGKTDGAHCSVCGIVTIQQTNIPVEGHDYHNGICSVCSDQKISIGLEFTLNSDKKSYAVSGIGSCNDSDVYIPSTYKTLPVTVIKEKAFYGCSTIVSVYLPESIIRIEDKAFSECKKLIFISLTDLVEIGTDVFRGSIKIEIQISHKLTYIAAKKATCTENGNIAHYYCAVCKYYYKDANGKDRLYDISTVGAHSFKNGMCTSCGQIQNELLIVKVDGISHLGQYALGTLANAIGIPEYVNVYTADGVKHQLSVVWDVTTYDKSKPGEYTIIGYIQAGGYYFSSGLTAKITAKFEIVEFMKGTADIVFVLDISGSMGDEIDSVKDNIVRFARAIEEKGVSVRWSAITYSDFTRNGPHEDTTILYNGATPWFTTASEYQRAIASIVLANGPDETPIDALMAGVYELETRKDARTFYILLTDEGYQVANNYNVSSMSHATKILEDANINVSVITKTSLYSKYEELAENTGGVMLNIYDNFAQRLLDSLIPIIYTDVIS